MNSRSASRLPSLLLAPALLSLLCFSGCYQSHGDAEGDGGIRLMDAGSIRCGFGGSCPVGTTCCSYCDDSFACVPEGEMCPPDPVCGGCRGNDDCRMDQYCYTADLSCSDFGECVPRPETCSGECVGVCGCDGQNYCNSCEAGRVGVNTAPPSLCGDLSWFEVCLPFCLRLAECGLGPDPAECPDLCADPGGPVCSPQELRELAACDAIPDCDVYLDCAASNACLSGEGGGGGGGAP